MTDLRKAAQDVLDEWNSTNFGAHKMKLSVEALSQALQAEPDVYIAGEGYIPYDTLKAEPEPVAWAIYLGVELVDISLSEPEFSEDYSWKPLYTTPPSVDVLKPVCYITQAALDALKRGASSSVRVWRKPDERGGDVALCIKESL